MNYETSELVKLLRKNRTQIVCLKISDSQYKIIKGQITEIRMTKEPPYSNNFKRPITISIETPSEKKFTWIIEPDYRIRVLSNHIKIEEGVPGKLLVFSSPENQKGLIKIIKFFSKEFTPTTA